jgi:site-specific recombinase XerD
MASLKKRGKYYSIVFKKRENDQQIFKTYSLGTSYKKIADKKRIDYEKLFESGEIDPFDPHWNLKEYEKAQSSSIMSSNVDSYYLQDLSKSFLKSKPHVTDATIKGYKSVIKLFSEFVGQSLTAPLVRANDIRSFCFKSSYSNATKRNYLRHLKAFFGWMVKEGIIENNPCADIHPPKKKDKLVDKIFNEDVLNEIITAFRKYQLKQRQKGHIAHQTQQQHWFKPLITTAFYTGMRRKELIQLRWEQVNLAEREIYITNTKGGLERTVIIFDKLFSRLIAWHKMNGNPKKGLVFPSPRSTDRHEIRLSGDNASKVFKSYACDKAKLKDTIHFHGLRHSCATFMIRQGFDVTMVKDMLGHKSIEVTMRYVNLVVNDRKRRAKELGLIT